MTRRSIIYIIIWQLEHVLAVMTYQLVTRRKYFRERITSRKLLKLSEFGAPSGTTFRGYEKIDDCRYLKSETLYRPAAGKTREFDVIPNMDQWETVLPPPQS
jgi:hypothetical protein